MRRSSIARLVGVLAAGVMLAMMAAAGAAAQSLGSVAQIAPTGRLRAALVKIPFLAKPDHASGQLKGVAPDQRLLRAAGAEQAVHDIGMEIVRRRRPAFASDRKDVATVPAFFREAEHARQQLHGIVHRLALIPPPPCAA